MPTGRGPARWPRPPSSRALLFAERVERVVPLLEGLDCGRCAARILEVPGDLAQPRVDRDLRRPEDLAAVGSELQREPTTVAGVGFARDERTRDETVDDCGDARRAHREAVREGGRRAGAVAEQ